MYTKVYMGFPKSYFFVPYTTRFYSDGIFTKKWQKVLKSGTLCQFFTLKNGKCLFYPILGRFLKPRFSITPCKNSQGNFSAGNFWEDFRDKDSLIFIR